jgi:hypothetical protein
MSSSPRVIRFPAPAGIDPVIHELILTAIHEMRLLRFSYKDKLRIAEPQDYGIQKGVVYLFTFQIGGVSNSGTLPDWRKFGVRGISNLESLDQSFPGSRAVPQHKHQQWDVLFACVDHA